MKKKKIFIVVAACLLLLTVSAGGTLAYLTYRTAEVKNTLTVGDILQPDDSFDLIEHEATDSDRDGIYTLTSTETTENTYVVLPGVDLPKDPFVRTGKVLALDAYVFVEVVDETSDALTVIVDDSWTLVDVTGSHGGDVYTIGICQAGTTALSKTILKNNEILVADATIADPGTVSFYGYMIQAAGFANAKEAAVDGLGFTEN